MHTQSTTAPPEPFRMTVQPAERPEWAYKEIEADFDARALVWREVSEGFYWQALEVLPPVGLRDGAFLVGEPWSHTADGHALRAGFAVSGEGAQARYFATISTVRSFHAKCVALGVALQGAA